MVDEDCLDNDVPIIDLGTGNGYVQKLIFVKYFFAPKQELSIFLIKNKMFAAC